MGNSIECAMLRARQDLLDATEPGRIGAPCCLRAGHRIPGPVDLMKQIALGVRGCRWRGCGSLPRGFQAKYRVAPCGRDCRLAAGESNTETPRHRTKLAGTSRLHAPSPDRDILDGPEDQVFDNQSQYNHSQ